jgi:hypothetical protein
MPKKFIICALSVFVILFQNLLKADVVILEDGKVITGKVLQQDSDGALIQMDYGTFRYPLSRIKDVRKEAIAAPSEAPIGQRIPNWAKIISLLVTNGWAHGLVQIPATVIDNGVLKDVPYISFRCNTGGYEINIYGDLDNPSGVEIGAVNYLVKDDEAKSNCVNFIASLLANGDDRKIVGALNLKQKDLTNETGMTFETTLPDEPDAYGGWWVSVYDEKSLATARASGAELLAITQPRVEPPPRPIYFTPQPAEAPPETTPWTASDFSYSRPSSSAASSGGGQVYVRGYYRANGTYVHSYTRSSPHSR